MVTETFFARQARGVRRVATERLAYSGEAATEQLAGTDLLVLAGTKAPVSFFVYPDKPSVLAPQSASHCTLVDRDGDVLDALQRLDNHLQAPAAPAVVAEPADHPLADGAIDATELGKVIANRLPEHAVVCNEVRLAGLACFC